MVIQSCQYCRGFIFIPMFALRQSSDTEHDIEAVRKLQNYCCSVAEKGSWERKNCSLAREIEVAW